MRESRAAAELTLALLEATVPLDGELGEDYSVLLPGQAFAVSRREAVERISRWRQPRSLEGTVREGCLVITAVRPTPADTLEMRQREELVRSALERLGAFERASAVIEARARRRTLVLPPAVIAYWLSRTTVRDCTLSISVPDVESSPDTVGILLLGAGR